MLTGGDTSAARFRRPTGWLLGAAASVVTTLLLVMIAVDVVPRPWDGVAGMAAFLPVIVPTGYLRLRMREG